MFGGMRQVGTLHLNRDIELSCMGQSLLNRGNACGNSEWLGAIKHKIFLCLAIWDKYWSLDRLAKRGLPHPDQCVLCMLCD